MKTMAKFKCDEHPKLKAMSKWHFRRHIERKHVKFRKNQDRAIDRQRPGWCKSCRKIIKGHWKRHRMLKHGDAKQRKTPTYPDVFGKENIPPIPLKQPDTTHDLVSVTADGDISYGGFTDNNVTMMDIEPAPEEEMKDDDDKIVSQSYKELEQIGNDPEDELE